jgi:hypothetical protein
LGEGELGRERDLSVVRMSELLGERESERERERERGLNVVGPLKTVQPSSIGPTGPTWAIPSLAKNSTIGLSYRFEIYVS